MKWLVHKEGMTRKAIVIALALILIFPGCISWGAREVKQKGSGIDATYTGQGQEHTYFTYKGQALRLGEDGKFYIVTSQPVKEGKK